MPNIYNKDGELKATLPEEIEENSPADKNWVPKDIVAENQYRPAEIKADASNTSNLKENVSHNVDAFKSFVKRMVDNPSGAFQDNTLKDVPAQKPEGAPRAIAEALLSSVAPGLGGVLKVVGMAKDISTSQTPSELKPKDVSPGTAQAQPVTSGPPPLRLFLSPKPKAVEVRLPQPSKNRPMRHSPQPRSRTPIQMRVKTPLAKTKMKQPNVWPMRRKLSKIPRRFLQVKSLRWLSSAFCRRLVVG